MIAARRALVCSLFIMCSPAVALASTGWHQVHIPRPGSFADSLSSVSALSNSDIWVGGSFARQDRVTRPLVEHWNGTRWSIEDLPFSKGSINAIDEVAQDSVWAVGGGDSLCNCTVVLFFDGNRWTRIPSDNIKSNIDNAEYAVAGGSLNDTWTAADTFGQYFQGSIIQTQRYNGSEFDDTKNPGTQDLNFVGGLLRFASNDVWLAGTDCPVSDITCYPISWHWNGRVWATVSVTDPYYEAAFNGISGLSSSDMWAVGFALPTSQSNTPVPIAEHFDGSHWTVTNVPSLQGGEATTVVELPDKSAWMGGSRNYGGPFLDRWNGRRWVIDQSPTADINGLAWTGSELFAVGSGGFAESCQSGC
jgi:hypothetical protein